MDVWERVARRTPVRGFCYVRLLEERRGLRRAAMQGRDGWRKRDEEKVVDSQLPRFIFALPTHQNWNKQSQAPVRASASRAQKLTIFFHPCGISDQSCRCRCRLFLDEIGDQIACLVRRPVPIRSYSPRCPMLTLLLYDHALDTPPVDAAVYLRGFRLCSAL